MSLSYIDAITTALMSSLLNKKKPYQGKCKDCKQPVTQNKARYCHGTFIHFEPSVYLKHASLQVALTRRAFVQYVASRSWIQKVMSCPASNNPVPLCISTFETHIPSLNHSYPGTDYLAFASDLFLCS